MIPQLRAANQFTNTGLFQRASEVLVG